MFQQANRPARVGHGRFWALVALVPAMLMGGCANGLEGAFSGAALGSLAGLGLGSLSGDAGKGAAAGAIIGGVGGAVIGDQNARASAYRASSPPPAQHTRETVYVDKPVYVDRTVYVERPVYVRPAPPPVVIYRSHGPRYHRHHHYHYRGPRYYPRYRYDPCY